MGRKIDLTGQRFGKWTVLREAEQRTKNGKIQWECICECGNTSTIPRSNLRSGQSTSCGCNWSTDLTGSRFGKLTVIKRSQNVDRRDGTKWMCKCDCGAVKEVKRKYLVNGEIKSCGSHNYVDISGKRFGRWKVLGPVRGRNHHNQKIWNCQCDCGNIDTVPGSVLRLNQSKSCGCLKIDRLIERNSGENNHNYNPELTDEERLNNRYDLYGNHINNWRKTVYSNNSYTCQGCGKDGGNLNAHHLNSWNAFPEQRFDTANGITLCSDCHKEFHHFNGYGDNTLEEFRDHIACMIGEEYLEDVEEALLSRESISIETRELQTT